MAGQVRHRARTDAGKRIPLFGDGERQLFSCLVDLRGVVHRTRLSQQFTRVGLARHFGKRAFDTDRAKVIEFALFNRDGDDEARAIGIKFGVGGGYCRVGVTILEVVLAHQFAIEAQAIWIVDAGALEEVKPSGLRRRDNVA